LGVETFVTGFGWPRLVTANMKTPAAAKSVTPRIRAERIVFLLECCGRIPSGGVERGDF
jgi:hypothetical protein